MSERTIAAIATPPGIGSIGVIRISGEEAVTVADRIFFTFNGKKLSELDGYSAAYGEIKDGDYVLDDAVALVFVAPHSFTGENTVEISVHGGDIMLRSVLRLVFDNGAFPAEPGEFTKRAFLNGKTDLTRAESIMGLISARSDAELRLSRAAHTGKVAKKIEKIIEDLTKADAAISVYSDYPDEDIEGLDRDSFLLMLNSVENDLSGLLSSYDSGKILREGIETAIVGKPNVGKSTLMNMLSGTNKSIVTGVAGTTRDVIEETVIVGNVMLRLADTAGLRDTDDAVESIGVNLAKERIDWAQLILAVFDCSGELDENDRALLQSIEGRNAIAVINKTDLASKIDLSLFSGLNTVQISAKENTGYNELAEMIERVSGTADLSPDSAVLINERQRAAAQRAFDGIKEAIFTLESGNTLDAVGICVDDALKNLFELTGQRVTTEVADEIFKSFCVGK